MDIVNLVNLTSRGWALPILAALHAGVPGRQANLSGATGATRSSVRAGLSLLIDSGWVQRNPGHGHPLRAEFLLTDRGCPIAALASDVMGLVRDQADLKLLRKQWTLPVLSATREPSQFSGIRNSIPGMTDRALSLTLKGLEPRGWIARDVDPVSRPPRPFYQAIGQGAEFAARLSPS